MQLPSALLRCLIISKRRKKVATSGMPQVGDKVYPANSEMLYEISNVSHDREDVNLHVPGTILEHFRVERKQPARTSNPFTTAEPVFDASEVMDRIDKLLSSFG
jgi:hypothetical protein